VAVKPHARDGQANVKSDLGMFIRTFTRSAPGAELVVGTSFNAEIPA
jgi:hypothetical protein